MSEERRRVLQMLQDGTVSADQAMELLDALDNESEAESDAIYGEVAYKSEPPPNMNKYRRFWKIPFIISFVILVLLGFWLRSIYLGSEGAITFGFIIVWTMFMFTGFITLLAFMSRRSTWLHVRVREKEGTRIAISLPLPLRLANWGIGIARGFVDEKTRGHLNMASEFINAARDTMRDPDADPLYIDVDDDDGDHVEVYIG